MRAVKKKRKGEGRPQGILLVGSFYARKDWLETCAQTVSGGDFLDAHRMKREGGGASDSRIRDGRVKKGGRHVAR